MALLFVVMSIAGLRWTVVGLAPWIPADTPPEAEALVLGVNDVVNDVMRVVVFASVPVFAWLSGWLYRRRGFNFAENCVLWLYVSGHGAVLVAVPSFVITPLSPGLGLVVSLLLLPFYVWAVMGFYRTAWWRAVLAVIACYIGWVMVVMGTLLGSILTAFLLAG